MKEIYVKWWDNGNKCFQILNYKEAWIENNIKPHISLRTNGARRRNSDKCLDITLTVGYIVVNYTNFDL